MFFFRLGGDTILFPVYTPVESLRLRGIYLGLFNITFMVYIRKISLDPNMSDRILLGFYGFQQHKKYMYNISCFTMIVIVSFSVVFHAYRCVVEATE